MNYNVTNERGLVRWFEDREKAIAFAEEQERQWREWHGAEVTHAVYYHGREVIRDNALAAGEFAKRAAISTIRYARKNGKLRTFRGGLVAVK
jgi:hypothetical protein